VKQKYGNKSMGLTAKANEAADNTVISAS
jgi:hypothetical protein